MAATREERAGQWVARTAEVSTVLAGGATRNGETQNAYGFAFFRAFASADAAGTLEIQQSPDAGATWHTTLSQAVAANAPAVVESLVTLGHVRARYVNGATPQTAFAFASALLAG